MTATLRRALAGTAAAFVLTAAIAPTAGAQAQPETGSINGNVIGSLGSLDGPGPGSVDVSGGLQSIGELSSDPKSSVDLGRMIVDCVFFKICF